MTQGSLSAQLLWLPSLADMLRGGISSSNGQRLILLLQLLASSAKYVVKYGQCHKGQSIPPGSDRQSAVQAQRDRR